MFVHYARQISATAQGRAATDPHLKEIVDVCARIEAAARKRVERIGMAEARALGLDASVPMPIMARLTMLFMAVLYAAYAWQIEGVRELIGLPSRGGRETAIDSFNRFTAGILLAYALVVLVTGRRLSA